MATVLDMVELEEEKLIDDAMQRLVKALLAYEVLVGAENIPTVTIYSNGHTEISTAFAGPIAHLNNAGEATTWLESAVANSR